MFADSTAGRWWAFIERARDKSASRLRTADKSKAWYKGSEEFFKREFHDWKGELVRGNLWQRDYDILHDSLWADDPRFSVTAELEGFEATSAAIEMMAMKVWNETSCFEELDTAFGQALHENIAWVALDYDRHRQLPRLRWIDEYVAVDVTCKGMIKRAQWLAECVERPLMDVYVDAVIPEDKRKLILKTYSDNSRDNKQYYDPETKVKLAYIWSKRGAEPWAPGKLTSRKLIIICDKIEEPVLIDEWPWPFLDHDQFPLYMLRLKRVHGEVDGVPLFELLESLFKHFNWAVSFNLMDAKRAAQRKILLDENLIREKVEQDKLESGKHLEVIKGKGLTKEAIQVADFGQGSEVVYKTAELAKQLHDDQSGITDVVRGQPVGGRATAEEVRSVKSNSAIVFQGIAKVLDRFSNEVIHDFILAICYFVPAWSRITDAMGGVWTKTKDIDTGQLTDMPCDPVEIEQILGKNKENKENTTAVPANKVVRPGVDAFFGPEHAYHWPEYDLDQLRRDFSFKVEAGSARADAMLDEQRNTLAMLQTLGPVYLQMGMVPQWFELAKRFILSFRPKGVHKLLPPPDIQAKMQEMMLWVGARQMATNMLQSQSLSGAGNMQSGNAQSGNDTMNMMGANPAQPFGAPAANGDAGPGSGFERSLAKRSSTAPV